MELSVRERFVVAQGPDVTYIGKKRSIDESVEREAVFHVEFQLQVANVLNVVSVFVSEAARAESAELPATHTVCTAGVEALFKWHIHRVAVSYTLSVHKTQR